MKKIKFLLLALCAVLMVGCHEEVSSTTTITTSGDGIASTKWACNTTTNHMNFLFRSASAFQFVDEYVGDPQHPVANVCEGTYTLNGNSLKLIFTSATGDMPSDATVTINGSRFNYEGYTFTKQ